MGIRYLLKKSPFLNIETIVVADIPSNDYPFFALAAIGPNRAQLDIGSSFIYRPPISDAWCRLDLSHVFVAKTLGVSVNHLNVNTEASYFDGNFECPYCCGACDSPCPFSTSPSSDLV